MRPELMPDSNQVPLLARQQTTAFLHVSAHQRETVDPLTWAYEFDNCTVTQQPKILKRKRSSNPCGKSNQNHHHSYSGSNIMIREKQRYLLPVALNKHQHSTTINTWGSFIMFYKASVINYNVSGRNLFPQ